MFRPNAELYAPFRKQTLHVLPSGWPCVRVANHRDVRSVEINRDQEHGCPKEIRDPPPVTPRSSARSHDKPRQRRLYKVRYFFSFLRSCAAPWTFFVVLWQTTNTPPTPPPAVKIGL